MKPPERDLSQREVLSPTKQALRDLLEARRQSAAAVATETAADGPAAGGDAPPAEPHRLSFAQQRMWLIEQTEPDAAAYNTVRAVQLDGPLDVAALRGAFARLIARHDVLRTVIVAADGTPEARVLADPEVEFTEYDVADLDAALALADEAGARAFDLARDVPIRALLARLDAEHHLFVVVLHHIASDEGSRTILWRDLAAAYRAGIDPGPELAPPADAFGPPLEQYSAFVDWQRRQLDRIRDAELGYWRERLRGAPQTLTLPPDRVRSRRQSFRGARRRVTVDPAVTAGVRDLARQSRATTFMTALAGYLWLIRQWTGEPDVVVGMPVTARGDRRFDQTIGLFVNTVVLRTDCSGAPTYRDLVGRVRQTVIEALEHQDLPFDDVVDALATGRDRSRNPLIQILVNGTTPDDSALGELPGVTATPLDLDPGTTKFDTGMLFAEAGAHLEVVAGYGTDVYDAETIDVVLDQYQALLAWAVEHPDEPLSGQALRSPAQDAFVAAINDTAAPVPPGLLHDYIERQAAASPDRHAVGDERSGWLTYRELDERANQVAWRLRELGVTRGSRVAICLDRSVSTEVGVLAILKTGGAYVPLDPSNPAARLELMLADAGVQAVLTDAANAASLPAHEHVLVIDGDDAGLATAATHAPPCEATPDDIAYVIYTSGSTGRPKGVEVPHVGVVNRLVWMQQQFPLDADSVVLQKTPLTFDVAGWEVLWPLMVGAQIFLAAPGAHRDPVYVAETIAAQGITTVHFVPSMLSVFLDVAGSYTFDRLRTVVVSGEALPETTRDRFFAIMDVELANLYGPTEASIDVTWAMQRADAGALVTIGRPIMNMSVHVLDDELRPLPVGVPGELYLAGVGLARGYLDRAELTAERFIDVDTSVVGSGRLYRTGDLARWTPAGEIQYLGRTDDQVKVRGLRIELGEIEAALASHPGVAQAAVLAVPDAAGDIALVGYVVPDASDVTAAPEEPADDLADDPADDLADDPADDPDAISGAVDAWSEVWERTYATDESAATVADDEPDFSSWISSFTQAPIPPAQMREWLDDTVARVRSLAPRRIAELGCGNGLLVRELADGVEAYAAMDFSRAAIDQLRAQAERRRWDHVHLAVGGAHEAATVLAEHAPFDVVVINSVAQYFPDPVYLDAVVDAALAIVARPGWIVFGDIRNLQSLDVFDLDVVLSRADADTSAVELAALAAARAQQETELVIHPSWFSALSDHRDDITSVDVLLKPGRHRTEMNAYRYDALLGVGRPPRPPQAPSPPSWPDAGMSLDRFADELAAHPPLVTWRDVPDARTSVAASVARAIASGMPAVMTRTSAELTAAAPPGVEPAELIAVAERAGYAARLHPGAEPGLLDVVLVRADDPDLPVDFPTAPPIEAPADGVRTNDPRELAAQRQRRAVLSHELAGWLRARLPDYMVPGVITTIPALPLSPNGKLDRKALPAPSSGIERRATEARATGRAPATADERLVAAAFTEVLGLRDIGADDDFFVLGGHSLSAARLAARISRAGGVPVSLADVFAAPTVAGLAALVQAAEAAGTSGAENRARRSEGDVSSRPDGHVTGDDLAAEGIAADDDVAPLSAAQERMLFLSELSESTSLYGLRRVLRVRAELDENSLARALDDLAQRHGSLRTSVRRRGESTVQVVAARGRVPLEVRDLRADADPHAAVDALLAAAGDEEFPLATGPLFRVVAYRLADAEWVLMLHCHHIVADGWSLDLLVNELAERYDELSRDEPSARESSASATSASKTRAIEAPPTSYASYAYEQRRRGGELGAQLDYWRTTLAGAPDTLALPTDRPRPAISTYAGDRVLLQLDGGLSAGVDNLARRCASTPFTVLFSAVSLVLGGLSGQQDIVIGTPASGRTQPEYESTVGLFVNTIVLRSDLSAPGTFESLVAASKRVVVGALRNQDVPFERLVEELAPQRDTSRNPIFQVLLNLPPGDDRPPTLAGAPLEPFEVSSHTARFDLSLTFTRRADHLGLALEYSTDLFDRVTIERLGARLVQVLETVTRDPAVALDQVDVVLPDEHAALRSWSSGPDRRPSGAGTLDLITAQAAQRGDATAVAGPDGECSYAELLERVEALAARLRTLEVAGGHVGLAVDRGVGLVVAQLAIWSAGAAYVPLDPAFPAERLRFMVEDAGVTVVIGTAARTPALADLVTYVDPDTEDTADTDNTDDVEPVGATDGPYRPAADDPAYVIYTSGSTGRPKGVVIEHGALLNLLETMAERPGCTSADTLLAVTTISFDIAGLELLLPLVCGGTVVLADATTAADPFLLAALLARVRPTVMQATPSTWRMLVESGWRGAPELRALCGGEPLGAELARALRPLVHSLWNCYGPTETTIWSTVDEVTDGPVTIGRPIANTTLAIRDDRNRLVAPGVVGELLIGGAGLARGYWQRPELTAERFGPDATGARVYRTGDLARWRPDGRVDVLGRVDHQVKIRGHRIELGEIEAVLESAPEVAEAVAVVHDHGAGDARLVSYVGVRSGETPDLPARLLEHLRRRLPPYMVPAAVIVLDALPRTANNKIDRARLPRPEVQTGAAYVAPTDEIEARIVDVWSALLDHEQISIDDDFFALGGHSLLASRMIARLGEALDRDIPLRALFEAATVRGLAERVRQAPRRAAALPASRAGHVLAADLVDDAQALAAAAGGTSVESADLDPAKSVAVFRLSAAQRRMWMLDVLDPGSSAYNVPVLRRVDGPLDLDALESALHALVARHDILRTTYRQVDGELVQVIAASASLPLRVLDTGDGASIDETLRREAKQPFDLAAGPVIRAAALRVSAGEHYLLLTAHHIAIDGGSLPVLLNDLAGLYATAGKGGSTATAQAAAKEAVQYVDIVPDLAGPTSTGTAGEVEFWRAELAGVPTETVLPFDRAPTLDTSSTGARLRRRMPAPVAAEISRLALEHRTSPFTVTVAALAALLSRHGAGDDIVLGTPTSGRSRPGLDGVVGPLINTVPLRIRIDGEANLGSLVSGTARTAAAALSNDALPFEAILDLVDTGRNQSRHPLFQVLVVGRPETAGPMPFGSATLLPTSIDWREARYDLAATIDTAGSEIDVSLEYRAELFDPETIEDLLDRLAVLVESARVQPARSLGELDVLAARDVDTVRRLNDQPVPAGDELLADRIRQIAHEQPDLLAVRSGDRQLTYAELVRAGDELAARLRGLGVGRDDLVGLAIGHHVEWLVGIVGAWAAGAGFLAIDPEHPASRSQAAIDDAGVAVVLCSPRSPLPATLERCRLLTVDADDLLAERGTEDGEQLPPDPAGLAYVIYTSGSTGRPKGSMIEHGSLGAMMRSRALFFPEYRPGRVHAVISPVSVDAVVADLVHLGQAATLDLVPDSIRRDPQAAVAYLDAHRADVLVCTPTLARLLIADGMFEQSAPQILHLGGEAVDADFWTVLRESGREVHNCYGPTEVTVHATDQVVGDLPIPSIGRPLAGVTVHVVDDRGQLVPVGVPGELWLGGPQVSRGYLGRPELTATSFPTDPWSTDVGARVYRTGDRVRLTRAGRLDFLGRLDNQVKVRGHRVELGEVETALCTLPEVGQAAVVVVDNDGQPDLAAFVVPREPGTTIVGADLRTALRGVLPSSMSPRWIVAIEELPVLPSGKIDRLGLAHRDVGADATAADTAATPVELDDPAQELVAQIWQEVLGVDVIGPHQDFFDLGGNSLLAISVLSRLRTVDVHLPVTAMFDRPTIAGVAELVLEQLLGPDPDGSAGYESPLDEVDD